jgi:group I intron endonuclease
MKQKICCIYLIENLINCKKYVGQTTNLHSRKISHKSASKTKNIPICLAIKKYGWENFEFTILIKDQSINYDNLDFWESYFIELFDTLNRKKGYNCESGGSLNKFHNKQTIQKMKIANVKVGQKLESKTGNYKGVFFKKDKNKWASELKKNNKNYFLGYFDTEIEGAKAYNNYAMYLNNTFEDCNYLLNEIPDYITIPRNIPKENKIKILENKISKENEENTYTGVQYDIKRKNYKAVIKFSNKNLYLGCSVNMIDVAKLYNQQAMYLNNHKNTNYILNDIHNYITVENDIYTKLQNNKKKNTSSKFFGVSFSKQSKKWRALYVLNKKQKQIGSFDTELEAANEYNKIVIELNKNGCTYKVNIFDEEK